MRYTDSAMKATYKLWLLVSCAFLIGIACQKKEQAPVQPEKLASSSPTSEAPPPAASGAAPGPLLPLASGQQASTKPQPKMGTLDPDAEARPAPTMPANKIEPGEVKLIKAGAEPRRALRVKTAVGHKEQMQMTMAMEIGMELAGKKQPGGALPPMVMTMNMTVAEVRPSGDIAYNFKLTKTDIPPVRGVKAELLGAMKKGLAQLVGLKGSAIVSDRGFTKDVKIEMPPGADPQMKQIMSGMEQAMNQIAAPFPEEAVGKGAEWQFANAMTQNGVSLTQVATYQLAKLKGDEVGLKVKVTQFAPKQKVASPLGVSVDLLNLSSHGNGKTKLVLDRLSPLKSIMDLKSDVTMGVPAKGQMRTMKMTTKMRLEVLAAGNKSK